MKRAIAAILACLILAGCADENASIAVSSESTSQTTSEATTATTQTTTPTNTTTATSAATTTAASTTAVTTAAEPEEQQPSIKESITYESVSDGHIFVDFDYITDYDKSSVQTIPDEIAGKAVEAVKETDDYKASQRDLPEYENTGIDEYLDADGKLQPIMRYAFKEDFDNSGSDEWFLLYDIPIFSSYLPDSFQKLSVLVYTNGRDATVMTAYQGITEISLLDYGLCRQLLICGNGTYGAGCHSEIFGVKYGRAVELYKFRGVFYKQDCFIAAHGWQSIGDFMYYDTVAQEYRAIKGKDITKAELQKMDSKNSLAEIFSEYDEMSVYPYANVIGGKYYLVISDFIMDIGTPYTYENGEFVPCGEDCSVRLSRCFLINSVQDIDYDEAIDSMVQPEEVSKREIWHLQSYELTEISPDNEFIDFDFIEDYKGERTPEKCADIIALARDAVMSSELYEKYCAPLSPDLADEIDTYNDNPSAEEFFDENGKVVPIFTEAFSEDFDGDGMVEHFVVMQTAGEWGEKYLRYVLVYINDSGLAEVVNDYYSYSAQLLDYGAFKHLIFGGGGYCGADSHTAVYGVENDMAEELSGLRGDYYKWECFLSADGWQACGDFMYFDTVAREYRAIAGELVPMETIAEMDSMGALADYINGMGFMFTEQISLIGGKYYVAWCGYMDRGTVFTYENDEFVPAPKDCGIRLPGFMCEKAVKIEDIEAVIGSMISPEEAIKQKQAEELPSEGHIFVDFSYIEDYEGTTDIAECGEWYDMAVEAVMQTDTYRAQNTALKGIATSDIEFRYEVDIDITDYLDENGDIMPLLGEAFIEDYDNDGTDECFMRLIIPFRANEKELWELHSFLVYCGDSCEILSESQGISFSLLDYGLCKQLAAEEYSHGYNISPSYYLNIYGVVQGKAEKLFYFFRGETVKKDCFLEFHVYQQPFDVLVYYDTVKEQYQYVSSANVSYDDAVSSMLSPAEAAVVYNAL